MTNIPLLDWDTSADKVLEEFPMLQGATEAEISLMKSMAEDVEALDEDVAMVRAIEILAKRHEEGSYNYHDDTEGGAMVREKMPV